MPTIEGAVYELLASDSGITSLVASRIRPVRLEQTDKLPALTYAKLGEVKLLALDASSATPTATIAIDGWADSYSKAKDIEYAVRELLHGFNGEAAELCIIRGIHRGTVDLYEPPDDASDKGTYHVAMTFDFHYCIDCVT